MGNSTFSILETAGNMARQFRTPGELRHYSPLNRGDGGETKETKREVSNGPEHAHREIQNRIATNASSTSTSATDTIPTRYWAASKWSDLFITGFMSPVQPTAEDQQRSLRYINGWLDGLWCEQCYPHALDALRQVPPNVSSRVAFVTWAVAYRNFINQRLGKKSDYKLDDAIDKYLTPAYQTKWYQHAFKIRQRDAGGGGTFAYNVEVDVLVFSMSFVAMLALVYFAYKIGSRRRNEAKGGGDEE